jgi:hypothetical protein
MRRAGPEERARRVILAQGLAALACVVAVNGAHAARPLCTIAGTPQAGRTCSQPTTRTPSVGSAAPAAISLASRARVARPGRAQPVRPS